MFRTILTCAGGVAVLACAHLKTSTTTHDSVVDRYVATVGGNRAWDTVRTRIVRGRIELGPALPSAQFTLTESTNGRLFVICLPNGLETREGFDGSVGWTRGPQGQVREEPAALLEAARRERVLSLDPRLSPVYAVFREISSLTPTNGTRDVEARGKNGSTDTLHFDAHSGLLVRKDIGMVTPQGPARVQIHLEDYRAVGAMKVPFRIRQVRPGRVVVMQADSMDFNLSLPASVFERPK